MPADDIQGLCAAQWTKDLGAKMVFVLHDVEGFEHNEIATMLECSTGNSKSQLHKARLKLRDLLRQAGQATQPAATKEAVR